MAQIINLKELPDEHSRRWDAMYDIRREQIERIEEVLIENPLGIVMSPDEIKAWLDVALLTLNWKRECRRVNIDDEVTRAFMDQVIAALRDPALARRWQEELEPIAFALKQLSWAIGADSYAEAESDDKEFWRIIKNIKGIEKAATPPEGGFFA
jgi:translation elongation factor EF-1beta